MTNKRVAILASMAALITLTGCGSGVSLTRYDSAIAEKENIQRQVTEMQNQLIAAKNKLYQLQNSGGSASAQTGPTDLKRVSWRPSTYIDKAGFKVSYPDTWKITTRGTANVPVEIQFGTSNLVPGAWVGIMSDSANTAYSSSTLVNIISSWQDYKELTSGDTVLLDTKTPASYVEFTATVDAKPKHIYALGYVDGDHWIYFAVWTIESVVPWDGNLMRQIAHTLDKASASEIASGVPAPPTTTSPPTTTTPATTTSYTDNKYGFSLSFDSSWTIWDPATDATGHRIFGAASPAWICPGVRIDKLPTSTASTVFDLIPFVLGTQANAGKSTDEQIPSANGINTTAHVIRYTSPTDGYRLDAKIYGFVKDGSWWTMVVYQSDGLGTLQAQYPDKIFASWKFN